MLTMNNQDRLDEAQIADLATRERTKALSRREWKHRLAGYGYGIRETDAGDVVETLSGPVDVCLLPSVVSA